MTRNEERQRRRERESGVPRGTVHETWYQREERDRQRDLWILVIALTISALALAVLK